MERHKNVGKTKEERWKEEWMTKNNDRKKSDGKKDEDKKDEKKGWIDKRKYKEEN